MSNWKIHCQQNIVEADILIEEERFPSPSFRAKICCKRWKFTVKKGMFLMATSLPKFHFQLLDGFAVEEIYLDHRQHILLSWVFPEIFTTSWDRLLLICVHRHHAWKVREAIKNHFLGLSLKMQTPATHSLGLSAKKTIFKPFLRHP